MAVPIDSNPAPPNEASRQDLGESIGIAVAVAVGMYLGVGVHNPWLGIGAGVIGAVVAFFVVRAVRARQT